MLTVTQPRQQRKRSSLATVFSGIGWPLLWGMAGWVGLYMLIHQGVIGGELVTNYLAGHVVEYFEVAFFCVGLAMLGLKLLDVAFQHRTLDRVQLPDPAAGGDRAEDCGGLLTELQQIPARLADSYLARRLRDALQYIQRKGSADELDEQLRYLADVDAARQHDSYALSRLIIWAIPILGFLGTVIGITLAITSLSPEQLASSEGIDSLTQSLGVAFNTTATALALSMVLMFASFLIDRFESELLAAVDERTNEALVGRFQQYGSGNDPQAASIHKMAEAVMRSSEKLVANQAVLWRDTIESAHEKWSKLADTASLQTQSALEQSLSTSLTAHADQLVAAEEHSADRLEQLSQRLAAAMITYAKAMEHQQAELVRQGEVMHKAVEASGRVTQLQAALNDNLQALAGAKNFEDTVMSLAAAIHLLNARLGGAKLGGDAVALESSPEAVKGRAA